MMELSGDHSPGRPARHGRARASGRAGHRGAAVCRRHVRRAARPAGRRARGRRAAGPGHHLVVAAGPVRPDGPARAGRALGLADPGRAGRVRPALSRDHPGLIPAGAPARGDGGAAGPGSHLRLPGRGRVLAQRAEAARAGGRPGRLTAAHPGRGGALAGRDAGRVGRGMLGGRGRADPQDRRPHGRHHAGGPHPDRGLRLPGGAGAGARPAAAPCAGAVSLLARRPAGRGPGPGRDRRARGARRDPRPAPRRRPAPAGLPQAGLSRAGSRRAGPPGPQP